MKHLLAILVDAFRYDYISEKYTPFIYSTGKKYHAFPLQPILGYSDSIRATIFTGVYPQDHNYWGFYKYSPETSPFRCFGKLGFLDNIPEGIIKRGARLCMSKTVCKLLAKIKGYSELGVQNIPFDIIDSFDFSLKESMFSYGIFGDFPTIFDVLTNNEIKFACIDSSKLGWNNYFSSSKNIQDKLMAFIYGLNQDVQFIFVYLHHLDHFAHRYGTMSQKFLDELIDTDETIRLIVNEFKNKYDDGNIIMFSDHGMTDTTNFVNFEWLKKEDGFGKDFIFAADSTMVRLWYLNDKRRNIRDKFKTIDYGYFLSYTEKEDLHINFSHRYYGDDIYLLKPGYSIFPNFVSLLIPYAMHAYHPLEESQKGIAMFIGEEFENIKNDGQQIGLIEFMPIILNHFGLEVPDICRGKSLLK